MFSWMMASIFQKNLDDATSSQTLQEQGLWSWINFADILFFNSSDLFLFFF